MPAGDFRLLEQIEQMRKIAELEGSKPIFWTQPPKKPGEIINEHIQNYITELLDKNIESKDQTELIQTDSFAEIVEKLCIVHTRMWYLEDFIKQCKSNDEIAETKKKIDQCFKVIRPRLVAALNKLIDDAVSKGKSLNEFSVKQYKGFDDKKKSP